MSLAFRRALALLTLSACASRAAELPPVEVVSDVPFAAQRAADRAPDPVRADAAGRATVTVAATLQASDAPAPAEILAELERNAGHLQRCWEARADQVAAGDIVIHAHVGPDGAVNGQCVSEDTVGDAELLRCANDVIAMGRYPATGSETVDVTIPFRFTPPNG